jgi:hypothetical protein
VREIGNNAFRDTTITSVVIPEGVTAIRSMAFIGCKQLAQVTLPSTLKYIGGFWDTALTTVVIPRGVTEIGDYAFNRSTSLASVTIPNSVTAIDIEAFKDCRSLTTVAIPDSVTRIRDRAFSGCTNLTTVTISPVRRNFEHLDYGRNNYYGEAFTNCPKLSLASQAALRAAGYRDRFN